MIQEKKSPMEKTESGGEEENFINSDSDKENKEETTGYFAKLQETKKKTLEYFSKLQTGQKLKTEDGHIVNFSRYWQSKDEMDNKVEFIYGFIGRKEYWWYKDGTPRYFKDTNLTLIMPEK